ncbi:MAG: metallophosphoesterase [Pseudomonadota bacterium]
MKLVQVTDCHVTGSPEQLYRGADPRQHLLEVIEAAHAWQPDLVLATGDLSEDGSEESYVFLAEAFSHFEAPVIATPGNHDHAERLQAHFAHCAVRGPLTFEDDWQGMVLGSARSGLIGGRLDDEQLDALDRLLGADDRPAFLALHHQPWPVGSPWIDRWALEEPDRFRALLERHTRVRLVLWGHVHQAVTLEHGATIGLGGPSSVSNSLPGQKRFTRDPAGPACRWLELSPDGAFETGLLRPDSSQAPGPGITGPGTTGPRRVA